MSHPPPSPSPPNNYVLPLSMRFLRTVGGVGCTSCRCGCVGGKNKSEDSHEEDYVTDQNQMMNDLHHVEIANEATEVDPLYAMMMEEEKDRGIHNRRRNTTTGRSAVTDITINSINKDMNMNSPVTIASCSNEEVTESITATRLYNTNNMNNNMPLSFPMRQKQSFVMEQILLDYHNLCNVYRCDIDIGVITTIRYTLSTLRISLSNFNDAHMLSICDLFMKYGNGPLSYIQHFDFSRTRNRNYSHSSSTANFFFPERSPFYVVPTSSPSSAFAGSGMMGGGRKAMNTGFGSHGAIALAKWIQTSKFMTELYIDRNPIGPYGASVIFLACTMNTSLTTLSARRCHVNESGAIMFAKSIIANQKHQLDSLLLQQNQRQKQHYDDTMPSTAGQNTNHPSQSSLRCCNLVMVDLSANRIGYRGCIAIDVAMTQLHTSYTLLLRQQQQQNGSERLKLTLPHLLQLDMEGNLVLQEVMNSITHGLGIILAVIGSIIMMNRVLRDFASPRHVYSCTIYSISLIVLYTSSTLYHSFFTLRHTKYVFEVIDKCAIYILIAGSYTPFLQIVLSRHMIYSYGLLCFLWMLCGLGVTVEFMYPIWKYKGTFSLVMFLCMGWSALVCIPEVARIIPPRALHLMTMGGISYTAGVPFFVRNNNLDHAIWHLFVLGGSIFHWSGVYFYVVPLLIQ